MPAVIFAPDSLDGQVRLVQNTVSCQGSNLVGLRFVLKGFQKNPPSTILCIIELKTIILYGD